MKEKGIILNWLGQTFMIYGITTLVMNIFVSLFGKEAVDFSTIFSLGTQGVTTFTSFEFLLVIALIVLVRVLLETDTAIKRIPYAIRTVIIITVGLGSVMAAAVLFGWFPPDNAAAWIMFLICFVISFTVSSLVSWYNEKQKNRRLEEALAKFKEEN